MYVTRSLQNMQLLLRFLCDLKINCGDCAEYNFSFGFDGNNEVSERTMWNLVNVSQWLQTWRWWKTFTCYKLNTEFLLNKKFSTKVK